MLPALSNKIFEFEFKFSLPLSFSLPFSSSLFLSLSLSLSLFPLSFLSLFHSLSVIFFLHSRLKKQKTNNSGSKCGADLFTHWQTWSSGMMWRPALLQACGFRPLSSSQTCSCNSPPMNAWLMPPEPTSHNWKRSRFAERCLICLMYAWASAWRFLCKTGLVGLKVQLGTSYLV